MCIPAFKPERCLREEDGESDVSKKLHELHSTDEDKISNVVTRSCSGTIYHMCQKYLWEKSIESKTAYFPPTYDADGFFTHATAVPERLIETANHFYTKTVGEWICIEMDSDALSNLGICTRFEEAKPVGETGVPDNSDDWQCPHIYGGIPGHIDGVVTNIYKMERDDEGNFLSIEGITSKN